jgi:hypothetical protein
MSPDKATSPKGITVSSAIDISGRCGRRIVNGCGNMNTVGRYTERNAVFVCPLSRKNTQSKHGNRIRALIVRDVNRNHP